MKRLTREEQDACFRAFRALQKTNMDQIAQAAANSGLLLIREIRGRESDLERITNEYEILKKVVANQRTNLTQMQSKIQSLTDRLKYHETRPRSRRNRDFGNIDRPEDSGQASEGGRVETDDGAGSGGALPS